MRSRYPLAGAQCNEGKFEPFKFYQGNTDGTYLDTFFSDQIFCLYILNICGKWKLYYTKKNTWQSKCYSETNGF